MLGLLGGFLMKTVLAWLLICIAATVAIAADIPSAPIDLTLQWTLSVDADGKLTALKPVDDTNADLHRRLELEVRKWRFGAAKINGVATPADTTLTVHVTLKPVDDGYHIDLRNAETGVGYGTMTAPKYPEGALMSHRGGAVLVRIDYDADGRVTQAQAVEGGLPKPGGDIERAAVSAVKRWTFRPESIGGHGRPGSAMVPVCFSVDARPTRCRFTDPASKREISDGAMLAVDPLVQLQMPPRAP